MDMKLPRNLLYQKKLIAVNEYFLGLLGEIINFEYQGEFNQLSFRIRSKVYGSISIEIVKFRSKMLLCKNI